MIVQRFRFQRSALGVVLACGLLCAPAAILAEEPEAEYQQRFDALDPDDVSGHYQLALWCKDQKAYRLLRKQATYVLRKNKDHAPAKLLLELARRELEATGADDEAGTGPKTTAPGALGLLTDEQIQFLRRAELFLDRPEQIRVKFSKDLLNRFFSEMEGTSGFDFERKRFFKLPPAEKAQLILIHAPDTFGRDVEILTDPQRFQTFRRQVLPIVLDNCATASCHGTNGRGGWRIYSEKVLSTNQVYTDYLILHNYSVENDRLVNRDFPEESLILTDGLAQTSEHSIPINAAFRDRNDRKYQTILDWVKTLAVPTPDYGLSLAAEPERR